MLVELLDRITRRRAALAERQEQLAAELEQVLAELDRLAAAEQVVAQLLAEDGTGQEGGEVGGGRTGASPRAASPAGPQVTPAGDGRARLTVPHRTAGAVMEELPEDYRRICQIVAEEGPVAAKRVTAKRGLALEPRHIEGTRTRMKRLAERGWLAELAPGRFTAATV